jgi:hypothetical protein
VWTSFAPLSVTASSHSDGRRSQCGGIQDPAALTAPSQACWGDAEVNARVQRTLALRVNRRSGPGPVSIREVVASPWVSPLQLAFA